MILIVTNPKDSHAAAVESVLRARGADFARLDHADYPSRARISVRYGSNGLSAASLTTGGAPLDLRGVRVAWYRRPSKPVPHDNVTDGFARDWIVDESDAFLHDVEASLDCHWLPGPIDAIRSGQQKLAQLRLAASLGFEIPPTIVTNDPAEARDFYRRHDGRVASKVIGTYASRPVVMKRFARFTEPVTTRDVMHAEALRLCPVLLQGYVDKRVELRITVVGSEVFCAEAETQRTPRTRHDSRRYDLRRTPHRKHALPANIASACRDLVARTGLRFGTIDMIVTPDGRYVFLELNPTGQWLWIEDLTGLPISRAVAELLIAMDDHSPEDRRFAARDAREETNHEQA